MLRFGISGAIAHLLGDEHVMNLMRRLMPLQSSQAGIRSVPSPEQGAFQQRI
jgi:hypothetical protein